ncbi:MAG: tyrosine-type recombinase/integrase [Anaeroplasmataceae bacterium]|nr:tyrosine-type recombinase/integrase [Anaeroplasmataceae bacterium]
MRIKITNKASNRIFLKKRPTYFDIFRIIKEDLNLTDLSPDILRRTFGTLMMNSGANIMCVKELLGHSTLAQTMKYCLTQKKQIQRECILHNPMYFSKKNA